MLTPVTRFEAEPEVVACVFGDGLALLDLRQGAYFTVNSVGSAVWEKLASPVSADDIARTLLERFDVSEQRCNDELATLLAEMAKAKLIRASDGVVA